MITRQFDKFIEHVDSCSIVANNSASQSLPLLISSSEKKSVRLVNMSTDANNGSFVFANDSSRLIGGKDFTMRVAVEWSSDQPINCLNLRVKKSKTDSVSFYDLKGSKIPTNKISVFLGFIYKYIQILDSFRNQLNLSLIIYDSLENGFSAFSVQIDRVLQPKQVFFIEISQFKNSDLNESDHSMMKIHSLFVVEKKCQHIDE